MATRNRQPKDDDLLSSDSDVAIANAGTIKATVLALRSVLKGQTPGTLIGVCTLLLVAVGFYSGIPILSRTLKDQADAFNAALEARIQERKLERAEERKEWQKERHEWREELKRMNEIQTQQNQLFREAIQENMRGFRDSLKEIWGKLEAARIVPAVGEGD